MSRRREFEIQFGSDSFLDVVCNIVGILIILIVIAGVRVSKMPVPKLKSTNHEYTPEQVTPAPALANIESSPLSIALPDQPHEIEMPSASEPQATQTPLISEAKESSKPSEPEPLPPLPDLIPSPELVARVERLEEDIASLVNENESVAEALRNQYQKQLELSKRLKEARELVEARQADLDARLEQTATQKRDLALARQALARLLAQVKELEEETPPIEALQHRITPVSRTVSGKEKHFRLEKGRVAEVPIEVLVTKLKDQIERRKDWLMKTRSHQGQIGPFAGFSMGYLVRAEPLSDFEALRAGQHGFRLTVQSWEIIPEENFKGETQSEALTQGSRFYMSLLDADPETTLTFWVYPDSFDLYRQLQSFAHDQGFRVAARPLPKGIPIAGSPNGSKSASQ